MSYTLKNARILDPLSPHHTKVLAIKIEGGVIGQIGESVDPKTDVYDLKGKWVTPGWVDLCATFHDPGHEHKEDLNSGLNCARSGGFTDVVVTPTTNPSCDSKSGVEYLLSKSAAHVTTLLPVGALSRGTEGENLSEILDLNAAGVIAFSDGIHPIHNTELLLKALQYTQKFGGLVINRPLDLHLSQHGQMNEGVISAELGFKGIPNLAEELMVQRDLSILEYTGGRMHFSCISTPGSVNMIKKAKRAGLNVTCDVPLYILLDTEEQVLGFDTNYKVNPPLRTKKDQRALMEALKSGVIDAICTDHTPQDSEAKNLEFDLAEFGILGLQTAFSSLLTLAEKTDPDVLITKFTHGPREVLGLEPVSIKQGSPAKLAIFDPEVDWSYSEAENLSKSSNHPLFGQQLTGRSVGMINGKAQYFTTLD